MGTIPVLKPREVVTILESLGFIVVRHAALIANTVTKMVAPQPFHFMLAGTSHRFFSVKSHRILG